jgi:hypothetical protein
MALRLLHLADVHLGMENYGRLDAATGLIDASSTSRALYIMPLIMRWTMERIWPFSRVISISIVSLIPPGSAPSPNAYDG